MGSVPSEARSRVGVVMMGVCPGLLFHSTIAQTMMRW